MPTYGPVVDGVPGVDRHGRRRLSTKELAAWALGLSLVPCFAGVLGMFCGVQALVRIRRTGGRGRGLAWAAVAVSAIWMVVITLGIVLPGRATRLPVGHVSPDYTLPPPNTSVGALAIGDCVLGVGPDHAMTYQVDRVPCSAKHDEEVFARFDLVEHTYPGQVRVRAEADQGCTGRFNRYVGTDPAHSRYEITMAVPVDRGWPANRGVICYLTTSRPTSGTARDTGVTRARPGGAEA